MQNKTHIAIERINAAFGKNKVVVTGHSGGKDSVVIHDLVSRSNGSRFAIVHNVKPLLGTSGDPVAALTEQHPKTLEFLYTDVCKHNTVTFLHSSRMHSWINTYGIECLIDGSRVCEHTRAGKSSQFIENGVSISREFMKEYHENGIFGLNVSYPIYDWSDEDVFEYIEENNLDISAEYVDNGELNAYYAGKK